MSVEIMFRRTVLHLVGVFCIALAAPVSVSAETIAVIGTGSVGSSLRPRFAELGHTVVYGSRSPDREDVQALAPRSMVVKAFSTISADTMRDPGIVDHPVRKRPRQ